MIKDVYKNQVRLLLKALPEVAKETCFALHGGTAINLFVRDMPRLSVDIDLTYIPIQNRETSERLINDALQRIKRNLELLPGNIKVENLKEEAKLLVKNHLSTIKIEVNRTKRGCFAPPQVLELNHVAQEQFDSFCTIAVVDKGHLYGGKICAAIDRQHPRDLFDIRYMLDTEGFTDEIKKGFLFYLISGDRPISELLFPHLPDKSLIFANKFDGMTNDDFSYQDYEQARLGLLDAIKEHLNNEDIRFLLSIKKGEPEWDIYNFKEFPAVQWKLQNIIALKANNPTKHSQLYEQLKLALLKISK